MEIRRRFWPPKSRPATLPGMWELTEHNALEYLRQRRGSWRGSDEPAAVSVLAGGVSNLVLRVETASGGRFVLKQSRPQLRTREAWFSDVERIYREQEVMEALAPLLPAGVVPRVLFADRERFVFAMEHAPEESRNWKTVLLSGEADAEVGRLAGRVLGLIHQTTGTRPELVERFASSAVFEQLRVDPFYRKIQDRHPDLRPLIEPLVEAMATTRLALCHGDYSPKNLLIHDRGLTLVDYETAYLGEPCMDLGFFFSHLLLKAMRRAEARERYLDLVRSAWSGYESAVTFRPPETLLRRGLLHLGVCLLARIDGTSPVDYLPEEDLRAAVRRLGRWLLQTGPGGWEEVLARAQAELG